MFITWHGQLFFEIEIKNDQGEKVIIATDPFDKSLGLKIPKFEAQILLLTFARNGRAKTKAISSVPFLIDEPGEYEYKEVLVKGIVSASAAPVSAPAVVPIPAIASTKLTRMKASHVILEQNEKNSENIIYKIEAERIKICYLGALTQKELDENQIEEIRQVDILIIPVGDGSLTGAKEAANIVSQIEPRMIIPMCYKITNLKQDIDGVEKFLKIMGREGVTPQKKIKVTPKDLSNEENKIVILEP
jgi:hypothetical protein